MKRKLALAAAAACAAALAASAPAGATNECKGLQICVPVAGPWVLAIIAACTMMAVIIFIAYVANYRPGAVALVMAVMFATPAILFQTSVGMDELQYRVLESKYSTPTATTCIT